MELSNLREANENFDELQRLKQVAADYAATRDAVIQSQLQGIETEVILDRIKTPSIVP